MKKVNNQWVDSNNNSWNCNINTRKQAEEKSKSLINCQDFKSNPFRIFFQDIGSRNSEVKIYWDCFGDTQIICGCFNGTISQFVKAVSNTHKDNEYARRYMNLINQVFILMEI